jgi:hypothetical protein
VTSIAGLITRTLVGSFLPTTEKVQRNALGGAIIAVLVITAYIASMIGAWFALLPYYGPAISCALIAVGTLFVALIVWGVTAELNRRARHKLQLERQARAASIDSQLVQGAMSTMPAMLRESPVATLVFVSGLAYALMKSQRADPK